MAISEKMRKAILDLSTMKDQSISLKEFSRRHDVSYKGLIYHMDIMSKARFITRAELLTHPDRKKWIKEYIRGYNKPIKTLASKEPVSIYEEKAEPKVETKQPKHKHYLDILFDRCQVLIDETNTLLEEAKEQLKEDR